MLYLEKKINRTLASIRNNPNVITGEEGYSRISTSTVRKSEVIYQAKKIEDNLKNLQKLYDKKEKEISDMGKFIKLVDQLKKDIEVLSDAYEK